MIRENKLYDELKVGDRASIKRVTANDVYIFAHASGNLNPLHLPSEEAGSEAVAPSMWVGALISSVLGNILPGAGTLYRSETLKFFDRAHVDDGLTITVTVRDKQPNDIVVLATTITGCGGDTIAEGVAEVLAPSHKVRFDDDRLPDILVQRHQHFDRLLAACGGLEQIPASGRAEEKASLGGALLAAEHSLIRPILIGSAEGKSIGSSMGFTALDGLPMATLLRSTRPCRALTRACRRSKSRICSTAARVSRAYSTSLMTCANSKPRPPRGASRHRLFRVADAAGAWRHDGDPVGDRRIGVLRRHQRKCLAHSRAHLPRL